jgi:intracellular sulfur oxidation DsrE/DsrF family protein
MRLLNRAGVAVAALIAILLCMPGHAAEHKQHRVVFQVDQNDPQVMNLTLNNVTNTLDYYREKGEEVAVEVVAYGPGLNMLREDKSPVKDRLKRLKEASFPATVQFSACHNTMMGMERKEGHAIVVVPQATIVPSGVVRLNQLQEDGWSYIRP